MKRQRGRGRKPGGGGGGGGHQGNRSLESNGPDVKIRGTAAQIYEKYSQYARDAQSGGDRVKYENYLQHAEHYYRVMAATMPRDRMFQPQGEGGMPMGGQAPSSMQQGGGDERPQGEGGEQPLDPMKVMDDGQGGDDDGYDDGDDGDGDEGGNESGSESEARSDGGSDNGSGGQQVPQNQQGNYQGRRRRRGRRNRHHDQNFSQNNNGNDGGNDGNSSNNNDSEARSALDNLARKQGAFAND